MSQTISEATFALCSCDPCGIHFFCSMAASVFTSSTGSTLVDGYLSR